MPYHPPLFPAVEAISFLILGVSNYVARLTVALFTAVGVLLLYELIVATHHSPIFALVCAASFYASDMCQLLSTDVMLEMPALTISLAAILGLARSGHDLRWRHALLYALLSGFAIWTKQTVFLGGLLIFFPWVSRRKKWLRSLPFWCSLALIGLAAFGLLVLQWSVGWSGIPQHWRMKPLLERVPENALFYISGLRRWWLAIILLLGSSLLLPGCRLRLFRSKQFRKLRLTDGWQVYAAWATAAILILVLAPVHDIRYALFAIPPLVVIGMDLLFTVLSASLRKATATSVLAGLGVVFCAGSLSADHLQYLMGPRQVAARVHAMGYTRVLFCGSANGSFIFEVRAIEKVPRTTIIRCDKLQGSVFQPTKLEEFAHQYGVRAVIIQQGDSLSQFNGLVEQFNWLIERPSASMVFEGKWHLHGSNINGDLVMFRFTNPSPHPDKNLPMHIDAIGKKLNGL